MSTSLRSFDRVADVYDATRNPPEHVSRAITHALLSELQKIRATPHVLEVGIGTGRMAVPLAAAGVRVTGIDISPKMLAVLRGKRRDIDVLLAEAAHVPVREASFDAVLFVHILHLIPDPPRTITETLRAVKPGGLVIHGGDDVAVVQNRADVIISTAKRELAGVDDELRDREAITRQEALFREVEARGGTVHRNEVVRWTQTTTGAAMLERQRGRDYSSSWSISEENHAAFIERIAHELSTLPGGLEAEIQHENNFILTIGRLP